MTKRNKLYARLIVDEVWSRLIRSGNMHPNYLGYLRFIHTQAHKNNCYSMALKAIGG